jgi:hypothetical protein
LCGNNVVKLEHVGAAGDLFGDRVIPPCLRAKREGAREVAWAFKSEGMHGSRSSCRAHRPSGVVDGHADRVVGTAATDVPAHPLADFCERTCMAFGDARDTRHELPGSAISTLKRILLVS